MTFAHKAETGRAAADLRIVRRGEMTTLTPYMSGNYNNLTTPTGTSEDSTILHFRIDSTPLTILPIAREAVRFPRVSVSLDLAHLWVRNLNHVAGDNHQDWQFAATLQVAF